MAQSRGNAGMSSGWVAVLSGKRQKISTFGKKRKLNSPVRPISYKRQRLPAEVVGHAM
jgi:hypothetical protein